MQNKFTEISIIGKIVLGVWDPENYAKIFATCNYEQQQKKNKKEIRNFMSKKTNVPKAKKLIVKSMKCLSYK